MSCKPRERWRTSQPFIARRKPDGTKGHVSKMICPKCGYAITNFNKDCPGCKRLKKSSSRRSSSANLVSPWFNRPEQAPTAAEPSRSSTTVVPTYTLVICTKCRAPLSLNPPRKKGDQVTCGDCGTTMTITGSQSAKIEAEFARDSAGLKGGIIGGGITGTVGIIFGALCGGFIGTLIFPIVGTIIGAIIGGGLMASGSAFIGLLIGNAIGRRVARRGR